MQKLNYYRKYLFTIKVNIIESDMILTYENYMVPASCVSSIIKVKVGVFLYANIGKNE